MPILPQASGPLAESFCWPVDPPRVRYRIDGSIDQVRGEIRGREKVGFTNPTSAPMARLTFRWPLGVGHEFQLTVNGEPTEVRGNTGGTDLADTWVANLSRPIGPGQPVELAVSFSLRAGSFKDEGRGVILTDWHPRLWWGRETHDDFAVKLALPESHVLATTGRHAANGVIRASGARSFGIFLGQGHKVIEGDAGGILVRCVFPPAAGECAALVLATALDAIGFYRERFKVYPQDALTIVPGGMDRPNGGYPIATGLVGLHAMEKMVERPELHWRWITAHEIGHQYWGEEVMEKDNPGWLWIGLGLYADREFIRARGLGLEQHRALLRRYTDGVKSYHDTTAGLTAEQHARVTFDFNNEVMHGKSLAIVSALSWMFGRDTFERIYRRCLAQFAGRQMGVAEFQRVCEEESRQDLTWFFEQWVRSNRYLAYGIASQECVQHGGRYLTEIMVERVGTLHMPIPVTCTFADGTKQSKVTDHLLDSAPVLFESEAPLAEAQLDPDGELAMVDVRLSEEEAEVHRAIDEMPWTSVGSRSLKILERAKTAGLRDMNLWFKLALALYDGEFYAEALDVLERLQMKARGDGGPGHQVSTALWRIAALVWQGHLLDLLGRREEAISSYREAARLYPETGGVRIQQDQYGVVIDADWIAARLGTPFQRVG